MIIYISSPYTKGDCGGNVRVQLDAAHTIMDKGHTPFAPLLSHYLHIHRHRHYEDWMRIDLEIIPRVDAVLRLPGESHGADREMALAKELGIPVYVGWQELWDNVTPIEIHYNA